MIATTTNTKTNEKGILLDVNEELSVVTLGENRVEISPDGKRVTAYTRDGLETKAAVPVDAASEGAEIIVSNDLNTIVVNGVTVGQADDGHLFIIAPGAKVSNRPIFTGETAVIEAASEVKTPPEADLKDGTIYIGRFKNRDGTERDWYAAASDLKHKGFFKRNRRLSLSFHEAVRYAQHSTAHGHDDWSVPPGRQDRNGEPDILNAMFNDKARIGGFDETGAHSDRYWSSSPIGNGTGRAMDQSFSDGKQATGYKLDRFSVRLVRSVPVK